MRTIRFRGKRVDNGEWVEGSLLQYEYEQSRLISVFEGIESGEELRSYYKVIPETVGQLWVPSLGIECYGGDLFMAECKVDDGESDGMTLKERIVKIIETNSGHNVSVWHLGEWWAYQTMKFNTFNPIGNIYDNNDLIK
jgi:hypothetical protein